MSVTVVLLENRSVVLKERERNPEPQGNLGAQFSNTGSVQIPYPEAPNTEMGTCGLISVSTRDLAALLKGVNI